MKIIFINIKDTYTLTHAKLKLNILKNFKQLFRNALLYRDIFVRIFLIIQILIVEIFDLFGKLALSSLTFLLATVNIFVQF